MKLTIIVPHKEVLNEEVTKIIAEGEQGSYCLLPRRRDIVSTVVPGILTYVPQNNETRYAAVDEGLLVKQGADVVVAVRDAVVGAELGELKEKVDETYHNRSDEERRAKTAITALETNFMKRIGELEHRD